MPVSDFKNKKNERDRVENRIEKLTENINEINNLEQQIESQKS